jgi:hypothetical protein
MRLKVLRESLVSVCALLSCGSACAQSLPTPLSDPPTGREEFLAAAVAAMMLCGLFSFLLLGRASSRTHVALALLSILIGAFSLLVLFGGLLYRNPIAAMFALLLLVGMFKLMSLFESGSKSNRPPSQG